jgi:hypothetical protein
MESKGARVQRLAVVAQLHGLRLVTSTNPAGYILVNARNVVEFGASAGPRRATLDEIETYLDDKPAGSVDQHLVLPRKRPRWMKLTAWP